MSETNPYAPPIADAPSDIASARVDDESIRAVARAQKHLLLGVLASLALLPLGAVSVAVSGDSSIGSGAFVAAFWLVYIARSVLAYRLGKALDSAPIGWAIGAIVPNLIGLIVLVVINQRATKRLKEAGWRVGLLGGRPPA